MPIYGSNGHLNDFDILVIGAGAAGLAAAARLARSPVSCLILEARGRSGGRALTENASAYPIDRGCGWLHSADRNPWRSLAETAGFTIDKTEPAWGTQAFDLGFSRDDQQAFAVAAHQFNARIFEAAKNLRQEGPRDQAAAQLFEPANRWNPLINAVSCYMSGAELEHISVLDLAHYADSEINWRIREGYGAAIADYGIGLPIALNCTVECIDHSGPYLRIETSTGTLTAQAVIVTLPPSLLLTGALQFRPGLPQKCEAAEGLPLGVADKLFIAIDRPEDLPADGHLFGRVNRTETASYHLRPFGRPLIEAYFGGALARDLEKAGAEAFYAFACDELALLFGGDIKERLQFVTATSWALDPLSGGSYSYARPGHADARQKLAQSVDDRLFFAGEACSAHDFSTAHGAYETGVRAAEQALAATLAKTASKAS
jgi:monoamine oxidase